jgi:acyl dehydratase
MTEASALDDWRWGKITDAGLEKMRQDIGVPYQLIPWISTVTEDAIWHFAMGLGDDNPLWWSQEYAVRSSVGRMHAPPAFLYPMHLEVRKNPAIVNGSEGWLPGTFSLYAGDSWEWHRPIWLGESLRVTRQLNRVEERQGKFAGRSIEQEDLYEFRGEGGDLVAELRKLTYRFERETGRSRRTQLDVPPVRYSDADQQRFAAQYAREAGQRRGSAPRYWDDVAIDDELGVLLKGPLTLTNMIGWMAGWGASGCFTNRMLYGWLEERPGARLHNVETGVDDALVATHWDDYFARESGMARGYDMGTQRIAWLTHCVTDWCGDAGRLIGLRARLRAPNYFGDVTWIGGTVTAKGQDARGAHVTCQLSGTNQRDELTVSAEATVVLPTRSGREA